MMNAFIWLCSAIIAPIVHQSLCQSIPEEPLPKFQYFEDDLQTTDGDVIFSSIIFRHGNRNEVYKFEKDKHHKRFESGDEEMGQLVKRGRQRAHTLGMWARARYIKLLKGRKYTPKLLKAMSSKVERTLQSAQLFLAGFLPPSDAETWNDTIPWQPVPVYPVPRDVDNIIAFVATCPRYNMEVHELKESEEMKKFIYETFDKAFIDYIENETGSQIPRNDAVQAILVLYALYDNLFVQKELELDLPAWAEQKYLDRLYLAEKKYFEILAFNDKTKRLKAGPLLKDIVDAMVKKRSKPSLMKAFNVYSGHDTTLAVLLISLGVYDGTPPPYSAALFIELRLKEGQHFVTIFYRTSDTEKPAQLELPNCKNPCTLDGFIEAVLPLIPFAWERECYYFEPDYNAILF